MIVPHIQGRRAKVPLFWQCARTLSSTQAQSFPRRCLGSLAKWMLRGGLAGARGAKISEQRGAFQLQHCWNTAAGHTRLPIQAGWLR